MSRALFYFLTVSRSWFWCGQPLGHDEPHRLGPQHPHSLSQTKHAGPICRHRQPRGKLRRSVLRHAPTSLFSPLRSIWRLFIFFRRFRILQQTHHSYWADPFHASHGLPVAASCFPPAYCWLPLMAARSWQWWRMGTPRTRHSPPAETQPQPHPHVSQFPPESTQLQCQLLCNGRGLTQHREQSTGWHGWAGEDESHWVAVREPSVTTVPGQDVKLI